MKTAIAAWLRRTAGRLDGRGCPLYILSDADWKQAYTQADTDWRQPDEKLRDMFRLFGDAVEEAVFTKKPPRRKETP